jgi:hypothetical protein
MIMFFVVYWLELRLLQEVVRFLPREPCGNYLHRDAIDFSRHAAVFEYCAVSVLIGNHGAGGGIGGAHGLVWFVGWSCLLATGATLAKIPGKSTKKRKIFSRRPQVTENQSANRPKHMWIFSPFKSGALKAHGKSPSKLHFMLAKVGLTVGKIQA